MYDALLIQSLKKGEEFMSRIRLRVKEVAEAKGMNITSLSRESYLALNTIRAIFRNPYRAVNTHMLKKLADALGTPIFDLMEEVPDGETPEETADDEEIDE